MRANEINYHMGHPKILTGLWCSKNFNILTDMVVHRRALSQETK